MKTKEERDADYKARTIATLTAPSGARPREAVAPSPPAPAPILAGLKLSDIQLKPLDFFRDNPANHVFDAAKEASPNYWQDLKRDIAEARTIINPVIALPDGTLLEGHSRIRIARELAAEGLDLGKIPARLVASRISEEEAKRRVYLGNLSRFEMDPDTRLALYAEIWPDYYLSEGKAGRPGKSAHGDTITARAVASAVGKSEIQVKRDRATVHAAQELAQAKGKKAPDPSDIAEARAREAGARRAKGAAKLAQAAGPWIALQLSSLEAELLYETLRELWAGAKLSGARRSLLAQAEALSQ
jgi:hypothetical protein